MRRETILRCMQFIAEITRHGWATTGFKKLLVFSADFCALVPEMLALLGFAVLFGMAKGTIIRLIADRGNGFIQTEEKENIFFHRNELVEVAFESLTEGRQVEFDVIRRFRLGPRAVNVRPSGQRM